MSQVKGVSGCLVYDLEKGKENNYMGELNLIYCRLKFWRQSRQNAHNGRAKLAVFAGVLRDLKNGVSVMVGHTFIYMMIRVI